MDKRYQVFVSSTYADLKDERQKVIQTLMEMDCIPAGMELFPASDEEQFNFIKRIIDDCDYYLLIVGGRYGSISPAGISYTEQEYDYAVQRGIKVIALIHGKPDEIAFSKSESDPTLREQLEKFKTKVKNGRLIKFWENAEELPGQVSLSLQKTIKTYPAIGWIRANKAGSEELLNELNEVRKENATLRAQAARQARASGSAQVSNIAGLDEPFECTGTVFRTGHKYTWKITLTWREIFSLISPSLLAPKSEDHVRIQISEEIGKLAKANGTLIAIDEQIFKTITLQFKALGIVKIEYAKSVSNTMHLYWSLTPSGDRLMMESRVIRTTNTAT